ITTETSVFTDESLRRMMLNKSSAGIGLPCEGITAAGLFAVWEDLLNGKFDALSIIVNKPVATELFDLIRTDGDKSSWEEQNMDPIEMAGLTVREPVERYEIWCENDYEERLVVRISRIYDDRIWKSEKYKVAEWNSDDWDSDNLCYSSD
ncbi:hypothetical protein PFISCL1PPCAC_21193, partial [Pristionchus fissidentatus]